MIKLNIPDMSCGHCVGVITNTVKLIDPSAALAFDLPSHSVEVGTQKPLDAVLAALADAGYRATVAA